MCTEEDMWIKVPNHSQTRKAMQFIPWQNTETQVANNNPKKFFFHCNLKKYFSLRSM